MNINLWLMSNVASEDQHIKKESHMDQLQLQFFLLAPPIHRMILSELHENIL